MAWDRARTFVTDQTQFLDTAVYTLDTLQQAGLDEEIGFFSVLRSADKTLMTLIIEETLEGIKDFHEGRGLSLD